MAVVLTLDDVTITGPDQRASIFFDEAFYREFNKLATRDALTHFMQTGQFRNWSPHPLFDNAWYLEKNPDITALGFTAIAHFLLYGAAEGRSPHPLFDADWYRANYALTPTSPLDAFRHFVTVGEANNNNPNPLFDVAWYRERYAADLAPGENTLAHYIRHRGAKSLDPHPLFRAGWYKLNNVDVWKSEREAFDHYFRYGYLEDREPHPAFRARYYLNQFDPDGRNLANPLHHYVTEGDAKGYSPHPDFDGRWYRQRWAHRIGAHETALGHFLTRGRAERLQSHPSREQSERFFAYLEAQMGAARPAGAARGEAGPSIVMVNHTLGGGTHTYVADLTERLRADGVRVSHLEYVAGDDIVEFTTSHGVSYQINLDLPDHNDVLVALVRAEAPTFIHYSQILGAPRVVIDLPSLLRCSYVVTVHDYYWACPRVTMIDATGRYCANIDTVQCERCIAFSGVYPQLEREWRRAGSPEAWRAAGLAFLSRAVRVFAPSNDTADRTNRLLGLRPRVKPHPVRPGAVRQAAPPPGQSAVIAVLGAIGPHKGSDLLLRCATEAHLRGRRLHFKIIGETDRTEDFAALPNVTVTGRFFPALLAAELVKHRAHAALFLSIWPETYSYTLTEAMQAGLYPIALDIGAIAERMRASGWGHLIPFAAGPSEINDALEKLKDYRTPPPFGYLEDAPYRSFAADYYEMPQLATMRERVTP